MTDLALASLCGFRRQGIEDFGCCGMKQVAEARMQATSAKTRRRLANKFTPRLRESNMAFTEETLFIVQTLKN
jgi:hypothetical protein